MIQAAAILVGIAWVIAQHGASGAAAVAALLVLAVICLR